MKVKIVLKPRSIATDCGLAIGFDIKDKALVSKIIRNNNLSLAGVYNKNGEKWVKTDL